MILEKLTKKKLLNSRVFDLDIPLSKFPGTKSHPSYVREN